MPVQQKWLSATVKLECACTFDIPVVEYEYERWQPEAPAECSTHGDTRVKRLSRLGTK